MSKADPKYSAGARMERKAFRDYLRRQIKLRSTDGASVEAITLNTVLFFVLGRQRRYDPKPGGLGRKSSK